MNGKPPPWYQKSYMFVSLHITNREAHEPDAVLPAMHRLEKPPVQHIDQVDGAWVVCGAARGGQGLERNYFLKRKGGMCRSLTPPPPSCIGFVPIHFILGQWWRQTRPPHTPNIPPQLYNTSTD
jgi:hypothetical protein